MKLLSSTAAVTFFIFSALSALADTPAQIPIGVSSALTGAGATWGADIKNGIEFANKKFGNGKFKLLIEDDRCDGKTSATIAQKFAGIDKVKYVLGYACSTALLSSVPVLSRAGVTIISPAASAQLSPQYQNVFRTWLSDSIAGGVLAKYAASHFKRVAILSEDAQYALQLQNAFTAALSPSDTQFFVETVAPDTNDYRAILMRLQQQKPDAFFVNPIGEAAFAKIVKQSREIGMTAQLLSGFFPASDSFVKLVGGSVKEIVFVDAPKAEEVMQKDGAALLEEFKAQYGAPQFSMFVVGASIEAFRSLVTAINNGKMSQNT